MALPGVIKPSGPREWALVTRSVMAGSRDTSAQTVGHCYVSDDGFVGRRPLLLCCAMCLLLCTQHAVNDRLSGFRCVCQHLVGRWFYPASVPTSTHKLADWLLHPQDARGAPRPGTPGEPWCARTVLTASARQPVSRTLTRLTLREVGRAARQPPVGYTDFATAQTKNRAVALLRPLQRGLLGALCSRPLVEVFEALGALGF